MANRSISTFVADRSRNFIVAALFAAIALVLTLAYVRSYKHKVDTSSTNVYVYLATNDIEPGTSGAQVAKEMQQVALPQKFRVPQAISRPEDIKGLYVTAPIYAKEQISLRSE